MVRVYYSPEYVAAGESFDTTRKSGWIAESLAREPIDGVELVEPRPLTFEEIAAIHDPEYVEAVRSGEPRGLAESQGFSWDEGMWRAVLASSGGVMAAVQAALSDGVSGTLSSGLHHAHRGSGMAFCTFNGLAIAAKSVVAEEAMNVLIVDLDAHCGGGTHSLIAGDRHIRQLDVSVSSVDHYTPVPPNSLDMVGRADRYLETLERRLNELDSSDWKPGLCIHNAGMDPHEDCLIGGLAGITRAVIEQRERMMFDWCNRRGVPVAFSLAGGYAGGDLSREALVGLHRLTIAEAARVSAQDN